MRGRRTAGPAGGGESEVRGMLCAGSARPHEGVLEVHVAHGIRQILLE